ncbi:hypothetical protein HARCEL1_01760 [Halococcoides cellulosivorans]|uniref:EF-hand domain-containing protein n=1 Tax=Halococcoides cellulosivorans TaxID=1679096 RepID=A0A2R4WYC0_9EURY|nr:hypothetical protein HARCEL1_01760 [Halococcoides cellulosivorans]
MLAALGSVGLVAGLGPQATAVTAETQDLRVDQIRLTSFRGGFGRDDIDTEPRVEGSDDQIVVRGAFTPEESCRRVTPAGATFDTDRRQLTVDLTTEPAPDCPADDAYVYAYEIHVKTTPTVVVVDPPGDGERERHYPYDDWNSFRIGITDRQVSHSPADSPRDPEITLGSGQIQVSGAMAATEPCGLPQIAALHLDYGDHLVLELARRPPGDRDCPETEAVGYTVTLTVDSVPEMLSVVERTPDSRRTTLAHRLISNPPMPISTGGIADASLDWRTTPMEPPEPEPRVSFDGDRVQIVVPAVDPDTDCFAVTPTSIHQDRGLLSVAIEPIPDPPSAIPCPGDGDGHRCEIEVVGTDQIDTVVVRKEGWSDAKYPRRSVEYLHPPVDRPDAIDAIDVTMEGDPTGSEEYPAVSVDGETITVTGQMVYGSSSCNEIRLAEARHADGHLKLAVMGARRPNYGRVCSEDVATRRYRLEATVDPEATVDQITVAEWGRAGLWHVHGTTTTATGERVLNYHLDTTFVDRRVEAVNERPAIQTAASEITVDGAVAVERTTRLVDLDRIGIAGGQYDLDLSVRTGVSPELWPHYDRPRLRGFTESESLIYQLRLIPSGTRSVGSATVRETGPVHGTQTTTEHRLDPIRGVVPRDRDGDGLYEDLNANGKLDFADVNTLFRTMDERSVTDHPAAYDFDGTGDLDLQDVLALFELV